MDQTERADAVRLGLVLMRSRRRAGLSQQEVAWASGMAARSLRRLERGERRTRESTLGRLARAIDPTDPGLSGDLVEAAGRALAPESEYRERVEARRARRVSAAAKRYTTEHVVVRSSAADSVVERHTVRRRLGRNRVRERTWVTGLEPGVPVADRDPLDQ